MAITLTDAARNAACDAIVDLVDVGATNPQGRILIYTTGLATLLVTLNMSNAAFGTAASGAASANAISNGVAVATGTAAVFTIINRNGTEVFRGTVSATGGGGDLQLSSTSIASGQTISVSSASFTVPAS